MNLPNALSILRLLLVPVFVWVYFSGVEHANILAVCVYLFASFTDVLDGMIARRYNLITKLGRLLDPLADKLMSIAVIVCIAISGIVPVWAVVVFAVKELLMALGSFILYKEKSDVLPSNYMGKAATAVFFVICTALMLFDMDDLYATLLISIAVGMSILALLIYFYNYMVLAARANSGKTADTGLSLSEPLSTQNKDNPEN